MSRGFAEILAEHLEVIRSLEASSDVIEAIAGKMTACLREGGKICFMGNGGSAADSQHLAAEFVGRFQMERGALPSIALTTDTSILTAVANDYGYEAVFERQVEALVRAGDVVVGISTSGNSPNVLKAMRKAAAAGACTVGFTGESGGRLAEECELCLKVPSGKAARIQEGHILAGHSLCELVEENL